GDGPRAQLLHADHRWMAVVDDDSDSGAGSGRGGLDSDAVRVALATLRPRYQDAISLRYLAGLSHEQAAEAMGCSKPVMAVTLHRALAALRRTLEASDRRASEPSGPHPDRQEGGR